MAITLNNYYLLKYKDDEDGIDDVIAKIVGINDNILHVYMEYDIDNEAEVDITHLKEIIPLTFDMLFERMSFVQEELINPSMENYLNLSKISKEVFNT